MKQSTFIILLIVSLCAGNKKSSLAEDENEEFVATHEWQEVKPGQRVRPGLHVRMNLEKGITEAKILDSLDDNEKNTKAVQAMENEKAEEDPKKPVDSATREKMMQSIESMLKHIKPDDPEQTVKNIYKSYDQLKKDFQELHLKPTMDSEIMQEIIEKHELEYKATEINEVVIRMILTDLEYYVHQFDNALNFVKMDGFEKIVYKNLNSTNNDFKTDALKLMGASLQNNVKVQIHALESGGLTHLMRLLSVESNVQIKMRCLFPLGALLRRFPVAQKQFVENGGLNLFTQLFELKNIRLHLKVVTLIYDMLLEHAEAIEDLAASQYAEKLAQYNAVGLKRRIVAANFCRYLGDALLHVAEIDANDYDALEKCLQPLDFIFTECEVAIAKDISSVVKKLLETAKEMPMVDQFDLKDYISLLKSMQSSIVAKVDYQKKTEL